MVCDAGISSSHSSTDTAGDGDLGLGGGCTPNQLSSVELETPDCACLDTSLRVTTSLSCFPAPPSSSTCCPSEVLSTACVTSNFFCSIGHTASSAVPSARRYVMRQLSSCPIRWMRSSHCRWVEGFQSNSVNTTLLAQVRLCPVPMACIERRATAHLGLSRN